LKEKDYHWLKVEVYSTVIRSTIRQWNSLTPSLRNVESIAKFKTELRKQKYNRQVPKHIEIGHRKLNITLTRLRCFASFLSYDLFQVNIVSDPSCRCGANHEDSYHFFDCSHYANMRYKLFHNLSCKKDKTQVKQTYEIFSYIQ
jgi:hypothetical protein